MRLAVVADEIGTSIEEQIDSLKKANISNIELRKIDDKYLWEFSKEELINFKKIGLFLGSSLLFSIGGI